jgi:hypothetical protein
MSDLTVAKMLVKNSRKHSGKNAVSKLEGQFSDLRRAVERIVVHLEKSERANKPKE